MADLITMLSAVAGQQGEEVDDDFNQTVLLLHGDGTNGAQNNTFLDSSTNNFTITRNGNTTQGTFSPFSVGAGEWSNYFDGSGDYLNVADNAAFDVGTGDFTVEAWVFAPSNAANFAQLCGQRDSAGNANNDSPFGIFKNNTAAELNFSYWNGSTNVTATPTIVVFDSQWHHIALVRNGTDFRLYVDGVSSASLTLSAGFSFPNSTTIFSIGRAGAFNGQYWTGYISNFRFVKGTAVYTSAFTPPTAPLTAITNTSLLTCQSNRFVDNSTNAFAITRNGDVRVTPFSPFAPTAAYSAGTNGGSGYFDGTGDVLNLNGGTPLTFGTGDFTIEFWVYYNGGLNVDVALYDSRPQGINGVYPLLFSNPSGKMVYYVSSAARITSTLTLVAGNWYHVALARSGTDTKLFINGVQEGSTYSDSNNYIVGTNRPSIGATGISLGADPLNGYMSDVRVVKGTAVYTSAFTPPTAPLTAIANTSLLLNFTNAGIIDNTGKNNLETVGNAQIDTTTKKYGTGSLEFDGTGDWLLMPNTPDQQLGTGNFTIEFWVYLATGDTGSARGLVAKGGASTGWLVSLDSSQKVVFTYTTSTITSSGAITTNAWNHIAVVREGTGSNQTKIYIGGTNDGTGTVSTNFNQTESMYVGANRTGGDPMKGFIDDLRITKGVARYTANFSVPGKAFPDL